MFVKKALEIAHERVRASVAKAAEFRREFRRQLLTIVATAFGVVAALFLQTAIRNTINHFIPAADEGGVYGLPRPVSPLFFGRFFPARLFLSLHNKTIPSTPQESSPIIQHQPHTLSSCSFLNT